MINNLFDYANDNKDKLSDEDIEVINFIKDIVDTDKNLDDCIKNIYQMKRDLREDTNLNDNINSDTTDTSKDDAKESLNDCLKSMKETKKVTSSFLGKVANLLRDTGGFLDKIDLAKSFNDKNTLETCCRNLQKNVQRLDKSIEFFDKVSVEFKTFNHNNRNLIKVIKGDAVSRQKVEPSEKFVKPLVTMRDILVNLEEKQSQKLEKVTDKILDKISLLQKLEENKRIIRGETDEPELSKSKQEVVEDNTDELATRITLFLQNTSHSIGTIEEIKEMLEFGDTESIKNCIFEATQDTDNYLIKNIDKFELENYPSEMLVSSKQELILIQKEDETVNIQIFDKNLNVLSSETIESNDNIFKDFSNYTKNDLKDLIKDNKCKIGDIEKFKQAVSKKQHQQQKHQQPKQQTKQQKQKQKVQSNVI